jgi:flagellar basal body-associated protein FliL
MSSSLWNIEDRWLEQQDDENDYDYDYDYMLSLSVVQRFAGALSLLGGLYIFWKAWNKRHSAFERIMIGLSFHTMLWGIYHLWGTAAIPAGTPGVYGARGTIATCSVQGFLLQVSMVVPLYYVFLSLYSWVVVLHGNHCDDSRYVRIEKYIHIGVHFFPIASAIYLVAIESFNPTKWNMHCWIASVPQGCGKLSGIECTRGPQRTNLILWVFGGLPALFFLLFPTAVMVTLTFCVYKKQTKATAAAATTATAAAAAISTTAITTTTTQQQQSDNEILNVIPASMVAKQSAIYLGSLYWVYLPLFIYHGIESSMEQTPPYWICLWVNLVTNSMGVWFAIVYWFFSTEEEKVDRSSRSERKNNTKNNKNRNSPTTDVMMDSDADADKDDDDDNKEKSETLADLTKVSSNCRRSRWSSSNATTRTSSSMRMSRASKRFSFNIFDGTASSGLYADFVFDGDSEDEEKDAAESKLWEACQTMNHEQ